MMYSRARITDTLPPQASPMVTAGFRWPPAMHHGCVRRRMTIVTCLCTLGSERTRERRGGVHQHEYGETKRQGDGEQPGFLQRALPKHSCGPQTSR